MPRSLSQSVMSAEVKVLHDVDPDVVNKLHRLPMAMAKARLGHAVEQAIGDAPLKEFGHAGLMSSITSGEKVPEYLARIYQDPKARRRFALALLEDDEDVKVRLTVEMPL